MASEGDWGAGWWDYLSFRLKWRERSDLGKVWPFCALPATALLGPRMREGLGWFSRSGHVGSVSERESVVFGHLEGFADHVCNSAAGPVVPPASHSTYAAKPKPRWDVHLPGVGNRGGSLAGVFRLLIAGPYGSAVSPRLSVRPARPGICRPAPAPPPCCPGKVWPFCALPATALLGPRMREGLGWFSRSGHVGSVSERESVVFGHLEGFADHVCNSAAGPVVPPGCFPFHLRC